jgi:predicted acetyltransferase
MAELLRTIREDDHPVSCLYPFRETFYERMGYASFLRSRQARFSPNALRPLLKQDLGGEVELLRFQENFDLYDEFMQRRQPFIHGLALRPRELLPFRYKDNLMWLAVARVNGQVEGIMLYRIKEYLGDFEVPLFVYASNRGKYLLLEWMARHIDQIGQVVLNLTPGERPETWFSDMDVKIVNEDWITPVGRVLDVMKIGGMHTGPGRFSATIRDPFCPWNEGSYAFETVDGKLTVSKATSAESTLSIQALTALVYGTHDILDFTFRGWGDLTPEDRVTAQTMFTQQEPFLYERY